MSVQCGAAADHPCCAQAVLLLLALSACASEHDRGARRRCGRRLARLGRFPRRPITATPARPISAAPTAGNLRNMVDDPNDLDQGRPLGPADGARETSGRAAYEQGQVKASASTGTLARPRLRLMPGATTGGRPVMDDVPLGATGTQVDPDRRATDGHGLRARPRFRRRHPAMPQRSRRPDAEYREGGVTAAIASSRGGPRRGC